MLVHYSGNGEILGYYDESIHETIPSPSKEITHEQWQEILNNQGKYLVDVNKEELTLIISPSWISPEEQEILSALLPSIEEQEQADFEIKTILLLTDLGVI